MISQEAFIQEIKERLNLVLSPAETQPWMMTGKQLEERITQISNQWAISLEKREEEQESITIEQHHIKLIPLHAGALLCYRYAKEQEGVNGVALTATNKGSEAEASMNALSMAVMLMLSVETDKTLTQGIERISRLVEKGKEGIASNAMTISEEKSEGKDKGYWYRLCVSEKYGFWFGISPLARAEN